jgi:CDGSH-type Zn-finger protein
MGIVIAMSDGFGGDSAVTITAYPDGPYLVRGPFQLLDQHGREMSQHRPVIALCRCGKSRMRPLCDGTHRAIGFRAPSGAEDANCSARRPMRASNQGPPAQADGNGLLVQNGSSSGNPPVPRHGGSSVGAGLAETRRLIDYALATLRQPPAHHDRRIARARSLLADAAKALAL